MLNNSNNKLNYMAFVVFIKPRMIRNSLHPMFYRCIKIKFEYVHIYIRNVLNRFNFNITAIEDTHSRFTVAIL